MHCFPTKETFAIKKYFAKVNYFCQILAVKSFAKIFWYRVSTIFTARKNKFVFTTFSNKRHICQLELFFIFVVFYRQNYFTQFVAGKNHFSRIFSSAVKIGYVHQPVKTCQTCLPTSKGRKVQSTDRS